MGFELNSGADNGPLADHSYFFGAKDGSLDADPDAFNLSLLYDYIKSKTDTLYPTLGDFNALAGRTLQQVGSVWDGGSMIARGFAPGDQVGDLTTYEQMYELFASGAINVEALNQVTVPDWSNDLLMLWDDSASEFKSITPANLLWVTNDIGSIGGGTQDIDFALGTVVSATVDTSTTTFTFSNPPPSGQAGALTLLLMDGGSQTVNWPASVSWSGRSGGDPPMLLASGLNILQFVTIDGGDTWYGFSDTDLPVFSGVTINGALGLIDGMTAPETVSGVALIYVDSADGDLKVKFGDGTVKTIVVDT